MTCPICNTLSSDSFQVKVLFKYDVTYFRCHECGFIQTETPYWLPEAYESAITSLDIGLVSRNLRWAPTVEAIIRKWFRPSGPFLDYGGGYGLFVRMMRDRGFAFIRQDQYCDNLFSAHFDVTDQPEVKNYELVTAFEVFEHLADPVGTVGQMLQAGKSILFTTKVLPNPNVTPETWWYFIPETGQHVALYSLESLHRLARRFGLQLYSDGQDLHLMTTHAISPTWFRWFTDSRKANLYNYFHRYPTRSLLEDDFQKVYDSVRKQPHKDPI